MSEKEMETLWRDQTLPLMRDEETRRWMSRLRRGSIGKAALLGFVVFTGLAVPVLALTRLRDDPAVTWSNFSIELLLAFLPTIAAVFSVCDFVQRRRRLAALQANTARCVDLLIHVTRKEMQEIRRGGWIFGVPLLGLIAIAKWQSIVTGRETVENAAGGIIVALVIAGLTAGILYHRLKQFLEPRLESLVEFRRLFDQGAQ